MIGLIGALAEEITLIRENMEVSEIKKFARMDFICGRLSGQDVVLLQSGVGKVKATIGTQIMIDKFKVDLIIFTGLAGSLIPNLSQGDLVVSNFVVQYDFDLTAFGRRPGELPDAGRMIEVNSDLVKMTCYAYDDAFKSKLDAPKLIVGPICSGDRFESDPRKIEWLQREFGAVAIEMEGAAVGHTCFVNDIKFIILRTISDTGGESATDDFENYLKIASENSFKIVETMLRVYSIKDDATSSK